MKRVNGIRTKKQRRHLTKVLHDRQIITNAVKLLSANIAEVLIEKHGMSPDEVAAVITEASQRASGQVPSQDAENYNNIVN